MLSATRHGIRRSACSSPLSRLGPSHRCQRFTVLALESSADDTCAAVVTSDRKILSNVVISQLDKHEAYGGIEPYVAIQEHQRNMPVAVRRALDEAKLNMTQIDGIAFTKGPGMAGCLSVCSNAAKTLASALNKPIVGVHHMQAHALTPILTATSPSSMPTFPFLTLLISGGHTLLLLALSPSRFKLLATTQDEAVGRTIDKVARALGLEWGGTAPGAALEKFCEEGLRGVRDDEKIPRVELVVPFRGKLAFSFSGLHGAVDRYILQHGVSTAETASADSHTPFEARSDVDDQARSSSSSKKKTVKTPLCLPDPHRRAIARAFQAAAVAQLEEKVVLALRWCAKNQQSILATRKSECADGRLRLPDADSDLELPVKYVVVSGGVASNMFFRERLQACLLKNFPNADLSLVFPPPALCTDNAAMIAWAAMHRFLAGNTDDYSIDHRAKWSIEELDAMVS